MSIFLVVLQMVGVWILSLVSIVLGVITLSIPFIGLVVHSSEKDHLAFSISEDPVSNDRPT